MRCDLCGTNVKVVGHTTQHYEPVVDRAMLEKIITDNLKEAFKKGEIYPFDYDVKKLADAIISAMYGDKK